MFYSPCEGLLPFAGWLAGSGNSLLVLRQLSIEVPVPRQVRSNVLVTPRAIGKICV